MNQILLRPIITEKSMREAILSRFTFAVAKNSNKTEVANAVSEQFKVKPVSVQTVTVPGKTKRAGRTRKQVKSQSWKKAIVTLEKGQKIDLFDVTEGHPEHSEGSHK